jgi:hypothetical protein
MYRAVGESPEQNHLLRLHEISCSAAICLADLKPIEVDTAWNIQGVPQFLMESGFLSFIHKQRDLLSEP